jgi:hypothetical protein
VIVYRVDSPTDACPAAEGALKLAFNSRCRVAVLPSQRTIGTKKFAGGDA